MGYIAVTIRLGNGVEEILVIDAVCFAFKFFQKGHFLKLLL